MEFPDFVPHPLLRGGNRQTLAAALAKGSGEAYRAAPFQVDLEDGDQLVVHDDCPSQWRAGQPLAILSHGLGGCHLSPYMQRMQHRLNLRGVRTWRVDLRGFGHSVALSTQPGHAGRSEDLGRVLRRAVEQHGDSPLAMIGFSMGGNITLKLLGELGNAVADQVRCAAAVAPPVNLMVCAENMKHGLNRYYSQRFLRRLMRNLRELRKSSPERLGGVPLTPWPQHLIEFDERFTAPLSGFRNAREYYFRSSSGPLLSSIAVPTLILAAGDDPVVPAHIFQQLELGPNVRLHQTDGGGHVGFFAARGADPDRCWMDWRLLQWLAAHEIGREADT